LHYIYTDSVGPEITPQNCVKLLELANRLCLPRLVALIEQKMVMDMEVIGHENPDDGIELALSLLESCQLHNSDQLADWCLYTLAVQYDNSSHRFARSLRSLHPENQAYLNKNRWPPVWFTREFDYYERCVRERRHTDASKPKSGCGLKRVRLNSGCLCFSKRRSHKKNHEH
jgi:Rho-related BTB domain-containing protein 1/2